MTIPLSKTQQIGYAALLAQKQHLESMIREFVDAALVENGGNPKDPWVFTGSEFQKEDPKE